MKKFKVGETYWLRSICDHDLVEHYKVIARTEKTITAIDPSGETHKYRISKYSVDAEYVMPWGHFSMAPTLQADNTVTTQS